jgi:hypothetical protein
MKGSLWQQEVVLQAGLFRCHADDELSLCLRVALNTAEAFPQKLFF